VAEIRNSNYQNKNWHIFRI